jgi:ribosomal protein L1
MRYLSTAQAGEKWGISKRRVAILCDGGRIEGAQKAGANWIIPEDAAKPADARIKSGKYIKEAK